MPGLSVLFWNVMEQPLAARVARLAVAHAVDVVVLAECKVPTAEMVPTLSSVSQYEAVPESGRKLRVYSRFTATAWTRLFGDQLDAWTGYRLRLSDIPELLFVVAHMPSKLHATEDDQINTAMVLADDIRLQEQAVGHSRTILVGDLNVNPFERAVVSARALHATMTKDLARTEARTVRGVEHPLFYNPMWGHFGDRTPGPPGTYFRQSSQVVNYHWNIYDQVLIRPALMDRLGEVRILDTDGTESLLSASGRPDTGTGSDHLPILFRLEW